MTVPYQRHRLCSHCSERLTVRQSDGDLCAGCRPADALHCVRCGDPCPLGCTDGLCGRVCRTEVWREQQADLELITLELLQAGVR